MSDLELTVYNRNNIGLCGFTGCGKSTIANILVTKYGYTELSFASALKDVLTSIFGWDRQKLEGLTPEDRQWREMEDPLWSAMLGRSITPRNMLTEIGKDIMRDHFHEEIWVKVVESKLKKYDRVVITDCRFPNEFEMVRRNGFKIVRIDRGEIPAWCSEYQNGGEPQESMQIHESNKLWLREESDFVISNNSSIEDLQTAIEKCAFVPEKNNN